MSTVTPVSTIPILQNLGSASFPDAAILEGNTTALDGGAGTYAFDATVISTLARATLNISGTTLATPIVVTTTAAHGFTAGQAVLVAGTGGSGANGSWNITVINTTQFSLDGSVGLSAAVSGTVDSVVITTSAKHGLVKGQRIFIEMNTVTGFNTSYLPVGIDPSVATKFSVPANVTPGTGGNFGDMIRTVPSKASVGRWVRLGQLLNPQSSISSLQNLVTNAGDTASVTGYYAPADGGGGDFVFDTTAISSLVRAPTATISGTTAATPIVVTTAAAHGFTGGQSVLIAGTGSSGANGRWTITYLNATQFSLDGSVGISTAASGTVDSVVVTTTANHGLIKGQRVSIEQNTVAGFNASYSPVGFDPTAPTKFSVPANVTPGTGGNFGDMGRSVPSKSSAGRWLRVDQTLNPRYYGAKCDGVTDDSIAMQSMIDANPGGHYTLPGSLGHPTTIYMGTTSLVMKSTAWILDGGGGSSGAALGAGTTLLWAPLTTGIIVSVNAGGTIRQLNLRGSEPFHANQGAVAWPDAILPDFTDRVGHNIFSRAIGTVTRDASNVVTITIGPNQDYHTYSVGTQIRIIGTGHADIDGLFYITATGQDGGGGFVSFSYVSAGAAVSFSPVGATSTITAGSGSKADAIVAGANFLKIEDVHIDSWGRFGIHGAGNSNTSLWADNVSVRNVTIQNCRGVGLYVWGGDANTCDFNQIFVNNVLVGGIYDAGFLGNTHIAETANYCGGDYGSIGGPTVAVSSIACTANVVTVTTGTAHGFVVGQALVLSGLADASYQAPVGSAVFVQSVTSTTFQYAFTHANGSAGAGGTARTATGTELLTAAGTGQALSGNAGAGFSFWIYGSAGERVVMMPYAETGSAPVKFGGATTVIAGQLGPGCARGYTAFGRLSGGGTNVTGFDGAINGTRDIGTRIQLWGGRAQEQTSSLEFMSHDRVNSVGRWYLLDDPTYSDPALQIGRGNNPGSGGGGNTRLMMYIGTTTYTIVSAVRSGGTVTVTTNGAHVIGRANFVVLSGISGGTTSFNGTFQVVSTTDNTFQFSQAGANESATPGTGTAARIALNHPGETWLCGQEGGSVALNVTGGTGGVRFGNGAGADVAKFDSTGKLVKYNSQATVSQGVVAECGLFNATAQSAAIASATLYAVLAAAAGAYRISYYLKVTRRATTSSTLTLTIGWTDGTDLVVVSQTASNSANATDSTGVLVGSMIVDAAGASAITYQTSYLSSGATTMQYKVVLRCEAL